MDLEHRAMNIIMLHKLMVLLGVFLKFWMRSCDFPFHGPLWQAPPLDRSFCSVLCYPHALLYEALVIIVYDNGILIGDGTPWASRGKTHNQKILL